MENPLEDLFDIYDIEAYPHYCVLDNKNGKCIVCRRCSHTDFQALAWAHDVKGTKSITCDKVTLITDSTIPQYADLSYHLWRYIKHNKDITDMKTLVVAAEEADAKLHYCHKAPLMHVIMRKDDKAYNIKVCIDMYPVVDNKGWYVTVGNTVQNYMLYLHDDKQYTLEYIATSMQWDKDKNEMQVLGFRLLASSEEMYAKTIYGLEVVNEEEIRKLPKVACGEKLIVAPINDTKYYLVLNGPIPYMVFKEDNYYVISHVATLYNVMGTTITVTNKRSLTVQDRVIACRDYGLQDYYI